MHTVSPVADIDYYTLDIRRHLAWVGAMRGGASYREVVAEMAVAIRYDSAASFPLTSAAVDIEKSSRRLLREEEVRQLPRQHRSQLPCAFRTNF